MIDPEVWAALISVGGTLIIRDGLPRFYRWNAARVRRNKEIDRVMFERVHQTTIDAKQPGLDDDT